MHYPSAIKWLLFAAFLTVSSVNLLHPAQSDYPVALMSVEAVPTVLDLADFDGDGKQDLFLAGWADDISVFLGRGNGDFEEPLRAEVTGLGGGRIAAISVNDIDGDGRVDVVLAVAGGSICEVSQPCQAVPGHAVVLRGLGDGRFSELTRAVAADNPGTVVTGDFNGDDRWDVAVSNYSYGGVGAVAEVLVLLGDPNGDLEPAISYLPGSARLSLAVADFDRDGHDDLAAAESGSYECDASGCVWRPGSTRIVWGRPDGNLATSLPITEGGELIAAGHFDRDAGVDLALISNGVLGILMNNGEGAFERTIARPVGRVPRWLVVDDLNDDGYDDLITANDQGNDVSVLLGDGRGDFGDEARFGVINQPGVVAAGDFTSDGVKDLAIISRFDLPLFGKQPAVALLEGSGGGAFLGPIRKVTDGGESVLAVSDFDRDGRSDLAVATPSHTIWSPTGCMTTPGAVDILLWREGGLDSSGSAVESCHSPVDMASADLDLNGVPDLVVACRSVFPSRIPDCQAYPAEITILLGEKSGTFASPIRVEIPDDPAAIALVDLDEDGRPDLTSVSTWLNCIGSVCSLEPGYLSIALGRGDGTFGDAMLLETGGAPSDIAAGDLDGDGHFDLIVSNSSYRATPEAVTSVFYGRGDGTVGDPVGIPDTALAEHVLVTSLNDDATPDLVLTSFSDVSLLLGVGGGAFADARRIHAGGWIASLAAGDIDADGSGDIVVAAGEEVSILIGDGLGGVDQLRQFAAGGPARSIGIGNFEGDAPDDIAVTTCASTSTGFRSPLGRQRCSGDTGLSLLRRQTPVQAIIEAKIEIRSRRGGSPGVIRWSTTNERTITGFNILRIAGNGAREILNSSPILCIECTTGGGGVYEYTIPQRRGGTGLVIEAICNGSCPGLSVPVVRVIGRP